MVVCLGKPTDLSETRGSVPIADRQSVHCVPVIVRALGRIKAEGTHKERSQTSIALAQEVYHSAALGDVNRTPMIEMSDRGLQVLDLKAAGIRLCSYMTNSDSVRSQTIIIALQCMHHAPSD